MNTRLRAILPEDLEKEEKEVAASIVAALDRNGLVEQKDKEFFKTLIERGPLELKLEKNGRKTFYNTKTGKPVKGALEKVLFAFHSDFEHPVVIPKDNPLYPKYEREAFLDMIAMGIEPDIAAGNTKRSVAIYFAEEPVERFGLVYYNALMDSRWFYNIRSERLYFYNGQFERVSDPIQYALERIMEFATTNQ